MARIFRVSALALFGTLFLSLTSVAHAVLIDKGGGLIYDDDLNLTWLANANAAAGTAFDDGTNTSDGGMSWQNAVNWAASLTTGGGTEWRLPFTADPDATCNGTGPRGGNCKGSEMGHLFYVELGGDENSTIFTSGDPALVALFSDIQGTYWSGTTEDGSPDYAWDFTFTSGVQSEAFKTTNFLFGWAVHDGDVSAIPAPGAAWLLGTGIFGLIANAWRKAPGARRAA
jgi:hypothetical protein